MDKLNNSAMNYHDIASLDKLRSAAQQDPQKALKQVAGQFESMFMQMLLKQMRQSNALFEADSPLNNRHTQTYRDMHDQQMAMELSQSGALGLSDLIVAQLDPNSSDIKPTWMLEQGGMDVGDAPRLRDMLETSESANAVQARRDDALAAAPIEAPKEAMDAVLAFVARQNEAQKEASLAPEGTKLASDAVSTAAAGEKTAPAIAKAAEPEQESKTTVDRQGFASPEDFVASLLPIVKKHAPAYGLSPAAIVAQAALESGWGKRIMGNNKGESSHNLFGIKADKYWQGDRTRVNTLEYRNGVAQQEKATFRSYASIEDSVKDYLEFVSKPRYKQAVAMGDNGKAYAQELQKAGYATDPEYANKIQSIMNGRYLRAADSANN